MAVSVTFNIPQGASLSNSGIGFFGSGSFGQSVAVSEYAGSAYATNSAGSLQGPQLNNFKYVTANSGLLNGSTLLNLRSLPNFQSTFEIRVTSDDSISVQNARLYVTERASSTGVAAGVVTQVAEIHHTGVSQSADGVGNVAWTSAIGSGTYLSLGNSPGISGLSSGAALGHSWYIAMSQSPSSVGSKLSTCRATLEYL